MSCIFFFFKQKTAYEMRISDWSSDVCSSDLIVRKIGSEKQDSVGDVERLADPAIGNQLEQLRHGLRRLPSGSVDRRADRARRDGVDSDVRRREFLSQRLHQQRDAALGCRIVHLECPWEDRKSTRLNSSN